jgi:hypothetical protein
LCFRWPRRILQPNRAKVVDIQSAVMDRRKWLIMALVALSVISAATEGLFYWFDFGDIPDTALLVDFLNIIFLILWIDADSKGRQQITRPFDYGFLLYLFWLPYLPYYLWRTRGPWGLLIFVGFLILLFPGWIIRLGVYFIRTA